jgi:PII-like signaling protein
LQSGTAASEAYGALDAETVHDALPNLSADLAAMLRLTVEDDESYEGTALHEAVIHVVRGLGVAGATVYRGHTVDKSDERPLVIEVIDLPPAVAELARCLGDLVDPARIMTRHVAMMRWHAPAPQ